MTRSQLTRAAVRHLNLTLKRIAERIERENYEHMLARVSEAMIER